MPVEKRASTCQSISFKTQFPDIKPRDCIKEGLPPKFELQADKRPPDVARLYLNEISASRLLNAEEERDYGRLARDGDSAGREMMIVSNLRLVVKIAHRYRNRGMSLLDMVQEGNLGLLRAVEKYDPERGYRFSTYATWWIRQTIERSIMNQCRTVRLPVHVGKELNSYMRLSREYMHTYNEELTVKQLAALLDKSEAEVGRILAFSERELSIDSPSSQSKEHTIAESIEIEPEYRPDNIMQEQGLRETVSAWLDMLDSKQSDIICRRFGFYGQKIETLENIGKEIGLTRERVRQIQLDAIRQLKEIAKENGFSKECC
ncbi:MAG: sigma-70 family RNA polymerase sigma factor [Pseudohongiellaceae bacterium]|nr:sigma-70 family RNA polymerase sigma factor [Pseudohongiellaceae bacterium]